MTRDSLTTLESMSCLELLEVIRLQHAIQDAKAAGLTGWERALRDTLAGKLGAHKHPAFMSVKILHS
jgi:hypothetical protein